MFCLHLHPVCPVPLLLTAVVSFISRVTPPPIAAPVFPFKAYFYALKMQALISSETLANFYNSKVKGKAISV